MPDVADYNYDPSQHEPEDSSVWLNLIDDAIKKTRDWQDKADRIDKVYANLHRQSGKGRDREFSLFWSNVQVLLPSIYARPPIPVCVPKFHDNRPELTVASEFLERACVSAFDLADINSTMLSVRDDLAIVGRGQAWVRYDTKDGDRICVDFLNRRDFLNDPARTWSEVKWVARRAWMTFGEMEKRFKATSGDAYKQAAFEVRKNSVSGAAVDPRQQCGVWELWHKDEDRVVWVTEGVPVVLDSDKPHLKLEGFFPCPKPVYATLERGSLIPVPDVLYYEDQLQEIDKLTARIHALADAIQVKGFYAASGEIGEAVEAALARADDSVTMIPVSNFAALGGGTGDPIVWMPIQVIAETIAGLVELRRQVIDDVYQIIGLADIMRGATEAEETLGAQRIKRESSATRVREKVNELIRFARDLARISAEVMAEEFSEKTLVDMSQMQLPTKADIKRDLKKAEADAKLAMEQLTQSIQEKYPADAVQQNPEAAQQIQAEFMQGQQQIAMQFTPLIERIGAMVSIDEVMAILRDQKLRPFMLDIETDSTIFPDEQAEKASRAEFMQAFSQSMMALQPLLAAGESGANLAGEMLKFALAPFRAGRQLEGVIDEFIKNAPQELAEDQNEAEQEGMTKLAEAEAMKAQAQMAKVEADSTIRQAELQQKQAQMETEMQEKSARYQLEAQKLEQKNNELAMKYEELQAKIDNHRADTMKKLAEAQVTVDNQALDQFKSLADIDLRANDQAMWVDNQARQAAMSERQQVMNERPVVTE